MFHRKQTDKGYYIADFVFVTWKENRLAKGYYSTDFFYLT